MPLDSREATRVLELARSETKRWGGEHVSLTHLAAVLERRWHSDFRAVFDEDDRSRLDRMLAEGTFLGDEADVQALLDTAASDTQELLTALHARLSPHFPPDGDQQGTPVTPLPGETVNAPAAGEPELRPGGWPVGRTQDLVEVVDPRADVADRDAEAMEVLAQLRRSEPTICVLVGEAGSGRSIILSRVVSMASHFDIDLRLYRVSPATLGSAPAAALRMVLEDLPPDTVLAIDDVDELAALGTARPDAEVISLLRAARHRGGARLVLVATPKHVGRLEIYAQDLVEQFERVDVHELPEPTLETIVATAAQEIANRHNVELAPDLLVAVMARPRSTDRRSHPGLALTRVDIACARASVRREEKATAAHITASSAAGSVTVERHNLQDRLCTRIRGQAAAIASVAERLALTRANLDLRPHRPDGVFLFVGPTGVGKTELAREVAHHLFGGTDRMIRLDMSEYAHDWAVSRLVGPMPGYVGSDEPETWLTTRVAAMPECVLLLDEIEKAHPRVWNTFLQVFDAGRLTDSRGLTADFASTVIVLTSNLGIREVGTQPLGFGDASRAEERSRDRLLAHIREQMAPELLNRMDEIVVFAPLTREAIKQIADREVHDALARLSEAGWQVSLEQGVVDFLATTGYDAAYGARHLQRNIERELLAVLASSPSRDVVVELGEGRLGVRGRE